MTNAPKVCPDPEESDTWYIQGHVSLVDAVDWSPICVDDLDPDLQPRIEHIWMRQSRHEDYDEYWETCSSRDPDAQPWTVLELVYK